MYYLESLVGEDAFNDFLRYYIRTNSLTSVTTIKLRANWEYFVATMIPDKSSDDINKILKAVDWDTWVYEPTLAPEPPEPTTGRLCAYRVLYPCLEPRLALPYILYFSMDR